ncbi:MAG: HlyD family efflux transporter periplasmic adaptor subunit [Xanthomonadales bacterium]|nr:HlyD family efflux transporter periplasmic adaptor subunit [Xanthomonadales bacterium]MCC6563033.1 HlyD family efflux transporter periplasmic adaptor subunit [Xanthomonadales bacterium]
MMHEPDAATGRAPATAEVPVLDPRQAAFLLQLLVGNDPLHLHFESPLWTPAALAEVIHDEFDLRLDPATLQRCLFELGLLPGDPLLALPAAERPACARWLATELPRRLAPGQSPWWLAEQVLALSDLGEPLPHAPRSATALSARAGDGRLCWWFCRGHADAAARAEFAARLARVAPRALLLGAAIDLDPTSDLQLLDLRQAQGAADPGLFRAEALRARERRIEGEVLLVQPLSLRVLSAGVLALLLAVAAFAGFGRYARTETASGLLLPASGVVRITAPRAGVVEVLAASGADVRGGDAVARIGSAQVDAGGRAVEADLERELDASLQRLANEAADLDRQDPLDRAQLQQALGASERERSELARQQQLQRQRERLLADNLERSRSLAARGVIARMQLQELEQQALSAQVQTLALARELDRAGSAIGSARHALALQPLEAARRREAIAERRSQLTQRLAQVRLQSGATLRAPSAGRVAAVLVQSGQSVAAGAPLLLLVDANAPLLAELAVPSRAIGFLRVGQEVQLKLDAFPYQKYGACSGRIVEISGAALEGIDLGGSHRQDEPAYRVRVALASQDFAAEGRRQALAAGMRLGADIVIDRPRIVEWLLAPLFALRGR